MDKEQKYYGKVVKFDEEQKFVESNILHFGVANENRWMPVAGCLDDFLQRLNKANKGVAACYQHDESLLIGVWKDFVIANNVLSAKMYFVDTPFVKDTVLPQLKAGILQGSSPTISAIKDMWNPDTRSYEIVEGVLCEISLVGLPADFRADIITVKASIEAQQREQEDFEIELLTI